MTLRPTEVLLTRQGRPLLATPERASAASPERLLTAPGPGCASRSPHVRQRTAGRAEDGEMDSTLLGHPHTHVRKGVFLSLLPRVSSSNKAEGKNRLSEGQPAGRDDTTPARTFWGRGS